jgi:AraC family transcriptional regulator of adaptative response / DNA-3-methyladenine glycosylase II
MTLDFDTCYRAVLARDPRFDGRFFTAVKSTGIYCRPVCPARTPSRRNMRFYPHAGAAEAAGFRACRRCRPETSPGSPEWNVRADLAGRAVRLIADGYVDEHGVDGLARRLAVTERHLRRLLVAELGAGPLALARSMRMQTARRLLAETTMPITEIAFASGFASIRQFNATFLESYGKPPSSLRPALRRPAPPGGKAGPDSAWLTLKLACREPFDGAALLDFLALRAVPGVEQVTGNRYARTIRAPGGPGLIELTMPGGPGPAGARPAPRHVLLRARLPGLRGVGQVVSRCRQLLDLDADACAIGAVLAADGLLAPLVTARPGCACPAPTTGSSLPCAPCSASRCRCPPPGPWQDGWPAGSAPGCRCLTHRRRSCSPGPPTWRMPTCPGSASPRPGRRRCARWAPRSPRGRWNSTTARTRSRPRPGSPDCPG